MKDVTITVANNVEAEEEVHKALHKAGHLGWTIRLRQ